MSRGGMALFANNPDSVDHYGGQQWTWQDDGTAVDVDAVVDMAREAITDQETAEDLAFKAEISEDVDTVADVVEEFPRQLRILLIRPVLLTMKVRSNGCSRLS